MEFAKRFLLSLVFVFVLSIANMANAITWFGTQDANWFEPNNWTADPNVTPGILPTATDWADIMNFSGLKEPNITTDQNAVCQVARINAGFGGGLHLATLNVSGGTLTCGEEMYITYAATDVNGPFDGKVVLNSGTITVGATSPNKWLLVGHGPARGTLVINGGTFNVGGGIVGIPNWYDNQNPPTTAAGGYVDLQGGILNCNSISITDNPLLPASSRLINIAGGALILNGDQTAAVQALQAAGHLITYSGRNNNLIIDFNAITYKTTVTASTPDYNQAWNPNPNNDGLVPATAACSTILSWSPGNTVQPTGGHKVYLGTTFADVDTNTSPTAIVDTNSYNPGCLQFGQDYYWRVDEVNGVNTTKGVVWHFNVADYLIVDDFEDYNDVTNPISSTWISGGGGWVSMETTSTNTAVVLAGAKSMMFNYTGVSSLERTFGSSRNWTANAVKLLRLSFYGTVGNTGGPLSVKLTDQNGLSSEVNYPTSSRLAELGWTQWNMKLQDFSGMNLAAVKKIKISIGGSGSGVLYIDEIRLYPSVCIPYNGYSNDFAPNDLTGDCDTDFNDLTVLVNNWLVSSYTVTPTAPLATGCKIWYKFNVGDASGTGGRYVKNWASFDTTNTYKGFCSDTLGGWVGSGGYDSNGYMYFTGDYVVYIKSTTPTTSWGLSSLLDPNAITISLWLKGDSTYLPVPIGQASQLYYGFIFHGASTLWDEATEAFRALCPTTSSNGNHGVLMYTRPCVSSGPNIDAVNWATNQPSDFVDTWVHYAFVKDNNNATLTMYRNGELVAQNTDANLPIGFNKDPDHFRFAIGGATANYPTVTYRGGIDDFRIYDYALSQAEVANLANRTSFVQNLWVPLNRADISGDNKVNFTDFAKLANSWLAGPVLWP